LPTFDTSVRIKILITIGLIVGIVIVSGVLRAGIGRVLRRAGADRARFWTVQALHILAAAAIAFVILDIWLRRGPQLTAVVGWIAAGLAIALQRVVTAFAAYVIVLRGNIYTVGDRITIGGVRGDVVALGFMQTTVMEMGQAPGERGDDPSMWVHARQYSGRLVRVTNDKIFDKPIYNYTRDFPFLWDELTVPIPYGKDYRHVEQLLLHAAHRHAGQFVEEGARTLRAVQGKYFLREEPSTEPRVYVRLTDNWLEMSLRFLTRDHDIRGIKDAMSREILAGLDAAHIEVASSTSAIVEFPPVKVQLEKSS
jgi:small-conductance mechanosensitive channel